MRWIIMILLLIVGAWIGFQSMQTMQTEYTETYITPLDLNLYACIESGCDIITVIPANTALEVEQLLMTEKRHLWKKVIYDNQSGYIGNWESNTQYAFTDVRDCAGMDCAIIDTLADDAMMLFAAYEVVDVVQSWTLIIYDEDKVGYVGPKMPGASKQQQMVSEATQTAEAQSP